jgi:hypothetical protein
VFLSGEYKIRVVNPQETAAPKYSMLGRWHDSAEFHQNPAPGQYGEAQSPSCQKQVDSTKPTSGKCAFTKAKGRDLIKQEVGDQGIGPGDYGAGEPNYGATISTKYQSKRECIRSTNLSTPTDHLASRCLFCLQRVSRSVCPAGRMPLSARLHILTAHETLVRWRVAARNPLVITELNAPVF